MTQPDEHALLLQISHDTNHQFKYCSLRKLFMCSVSLLPPFPGLIEEG